MKEFDFDELDKAVNSLMANAKVKDETTSEPEVAPEDKPVLELTPSEEKPETLLQPVQTVESKPESDQESNDTPAVEEEKESEAPMVSAPAEPEAGKPVTAPRRSGRFMDVVHPSSDMRPSLRTHSEAIVSPISTNITPESSPEKPEVAVETVSAAEAEEEVSPVFDPIAFEENKKTDEDDMTDDDADIAPHVSSDEPEEAMPDLDLNLTKSESPALESESANGPSPFLADAKVEKRPLNSEAVTPSDTNEEVAVAAEEKDSEVPAEPQPAEFGSDILAVESGTVTAEPAVEDEPTPQYKGVTTTAAPATVAPVSISQQYREQPSSTPEDHQAIYDTAAHPALAHPAKKRSGWWIVLWIVLLLALGAGGAAALYMLKMI